MGAARTRLQPFADSLELAFEIVHARVAQLAEQQTHHCRSTAAVQPVLSSNMPAQMKAANRTEQHEQQ
jgi:hypothetical protein